MKKFIPLFVIASIFAVSCSEVCVDPVVSVSSNDVQLSVESSENMDNSLLPSTVISEELSSVHSLASSLEETTETKTRRAATPTTGATTTSASGRRVVSMGTNK